MFSTTKSSDKTIKLDFSEGYSSVIIPSKNNKFTLCISSQIGCPIGCKFCRSGNQKFIRNLTTKEIIEQVRISNDLLKKENKDHSITSVVFMGMGEPMLNINNVLNSINIINKEFHIPFRRITLSTIGIDLDKLLSAKFNIAISLHSPNEEIRQEITNSLTSINNILDFCKEFSKNRKNQNGVMIEYALIKDINDSDEDLNPLLNLDWPSNTNFNLIEFNDYKEFQASDKSKLNYFKKKIINAGFKCFIRESRGKDIDAACGMLNVNL